MLCDLWRACYLWSFCYFHYKNKEFSSFTFACKFPEFLSVCTSFTAPSVSHLSSSWLAVNEISEANLNELPTIIFNHGTIVVLPTFMILGCLNKDLECHSMFFKLCLEFCKWSVCCFFITVIGKEFWCSCLFLIEKLQSLQQILLCINWHYIGGDFLEPVGKQSVLKINMVSIR